MTIHLSRPAAKRATSTSTAPVQAGYRRRGRRLSVLTITSIMVLGTLAILAILTRTVVALFGSARYVSR